MGREDGTGELSPSHLLDGVVADEEDGVTPRAAPHPHIGTGAQGTAQAAGGCPHHLCQDREQTLLVSIHPDIPQLIAPLQGSVPPGNRIPTAPISLVGCCHISGSALLPEGDFFLSLSCLQPALPCKGLPCQAHIHEQQSLGHCSNLPKLAPKPHPESWPAAYPALGDV